MSKVDQCYLRIHEVPPLQYPKKSYKIKFTMQDKLYIKQREHGIDFIGSLFKLAIMTLVSNFVKFSTTLTTSFKKYNVMVP